MRLVPINSTTAIATLNDEPSGERIDPERHVVESEEAQQLEITQGSLEVRGDSFKNVDTSSTPPVGWRKCSQCAYSGPISTFPLRLNGSGHVRTCVKHTRPAKHKNLSDLVNPTSPVLPSHTSSPPNGNNSTPGASSSKTNPDKPPIAPTNALEMILWEELLRAIQEQAKGKIEIDRFASLDPTHKGVVGETMLIRANTLIEEVKHAAGYRFKYVFAVCIHSMSTTGLMLFPKLQTENG